MKIAVTGASGFIGGNLCFYLEKNGYTVYPICNTTNLVSDHFGKNCYFSGVFGVREKVFSQVDGIMHMSANNDTLSDQSYEMIKANVIESKNLLKLALKYKHKFFVYASSTAVYGQTDLTLDESVITNPANVYAKSKLAFDNYMLKTNPNIKWCGLRFCNVYGPYEQDKGRRSSYLGQIIKTMMDGKKVKLFEHGEQKRDWVHVEDICQACCKSIYTKENSIYNIGSGRSISFNDLFDNIASKLMIFDKPKYILNKQKEQYQNFTQVDFKKATKNFGYFPEYDLDKGIEEYIEYFQSGLIK
jgi:ADP-L-glycero-D-manno-heptose 6-epimerase